MKVLASGVAFIGRRFFQALLVMLAILVVAFAVRQSLGDPLREIMGEAVPESERVELRRALGLDDPWPVQLGRYLGRAAMGDLGTSIIYKKPTVGVVLSKFPASFELVLGASFFVLLLCVPGGIYSAVRPRSFGARAILSVSVLGISVPVFLTGILLISVFSVWLGWLPAFGRGETVSLGGWDTGLLTVDGLRHLLLPALTLSSIMVPLFIRLIRGAMLDELGHDYVRTAYAKGARPLRVWVAHALRNALLPLVAIGGLQAGTLIAYTLLTETVFQWPGMGFLFLEAVTRSDIPLITTYLVLVGLLFVIVNTLVDLLSLALDPRVSLEGRSMTAEATHTVDRPGLKILADFVAERPGAAVAGAVLAVVAAAALLAPLIAPQDPFDLKAFDVLDAELPPFWLEGSDPRFVLGTDAQGRDLFSAILYGTRISLLVGLLAVAIQAVIGISAGLLAGYFGGRLDTFVTRLADVQLALSTLMMAIIVMALFRAGLGGEALSRFAVPLLVLVIGLAEWPIFARTARAATLVESAKDYVRAARAVGASGLAIVRRHILPNIASPLVVVATTQVAGAIMAEAALSFLGLGMQPTKPSLGTLIRSGYDLMFAGAWWVTVLPGLVLIGVLISVNVLGDALRDGLNPRTRAR